MYFIVSYYKFLVCSNIFVKNVCYFYIFLCVNNMLLLHNYLKFNDIIGESKLKTIGESKQ